MKRLLSLFLAFTLLFSLTACEQSKENSNAPPQEESPMDSSGERAAYYPLTLTDQAGRTVTIEADPARIVSGYYISTSLLIALGLKNRLVGIEAKADKRAIYHLSAPELIELPNVGTAKEFDLEGCAALEPDLVILPMSLKNSATTLEELGITVLVVNPESQELLEQAIDLVASAVDCKEQAEALRTFSAAKGAWLEDALSGTEQPRVYLAGNSSLFSTAGGKMYQSDMITAAGGSNVAAELTDSYWSKIDYEQLLTWDPEYIILASNAAYTCDDVLNDPNLSGCTAVVNGDIYQLPSKAEAWDSPVPSGILGSIWLAGILHPEQCSQDDCDAIIEEYYETFYRFSYREA